MKLSEYVSMANCLLPSPSPPPDSSFRKVSQRYTCGLYSNKVLKNLNELRISKKFCDVVLSASGKSIHAHRALLSSGSPYFQAMFTGGLAEEELRTVEIQSMEFEILSVIVDFIYTGEINLDQGNVQDLLVAADMLGMPEVINSCEDFLQKELHPSNCLGIFRFAESHHCVNLMKTSKTFIQDNFMALSMEEEFTELPKETLIMIISSERLKIDNEFQVFQAAMRWILHQVSVRKRYVFEILQHIRLSLIPARLLEKFHLECPDISLKVALKSMQRDLQQHKGTLVSLHSQPRECARKNIFVIGGSKREIISSWTRTEYTFESVECYNTFRKEWKKIAPMGIGRIMPGVALLNGKIYVVGGERESQILANGEVYDPQEDSWNTMACMIIPRCEFGLCAFDNFLYAFGGWVGEDIGGTIEKYDPEFNEWSLEASMPEPRFSMGVATHQGLIYIVGGCTLCKRHLKEVLCYNPVTTEWSTLAPMLVPRSQMGVAILDNYLYVVGGTNRNDESLKSIERYSFEENKWNEISSMKVGRASPAVAAVDGNLYVIGGDQTHEMSDFYRAQVTISSVERYDVLSGVWHEVTPLPESRSEAGAVVI